MPLQRSWYFHKYSWNISAGVLKVFIGRLQSLCWLLLPSSSSVGFLTGSHRQVVKSPFQCCLFVCLLSVCLLDLFDFFVHFLFASSLGHTGKLRKHLLTPIKCCLLNLFVCGICWIVFLRQVLKALDVYIFLVSSLGHSGNPTLIHSHTKSKEYSLALPEYPMSCNECEPFAQFYLEVFLISCSISHVFVSA